MSRTLIITRLYSELFDLLVAFAVQRGVEPDDAEDIVQNIFTGLLEKDDSVGGNRITDRYLYAAVRNACATAAKRQAQKEATHVDIHDFAVPCDDEGNSDIEDGRIPPDVVVTAYRAVMDHLHPNYREALELRLHSGLTTAEVAEHMGVSRKAAQNYCDRGFAALRNRLRAAGLWPE